MDGILGRAEAIRRAEKAAVLTRCVIGKGLSRKSASRHDNMTIKWGTLIMPPLEKRTVSLPVEQVNYIDLLVASGGYASASEVVRAGLSVLQERDAAINRWLIDEVAPVYDAMQADPARGRSVEQVADRLREHHLKRQG